MASRWPMALPIIVVTLAAATPFALYLSRVPGLGEFDYQIYFRLIFYNDFANSLAMLGAMALALVAAPMRHWTATAADWTSRNSVVICVATFVIFAVTALIVYQRFPLAMDEYAPLLQARIFAQGDIATTYPPDLLNHMVVPGFQGMFILVNHETGQAASAYWPGLAMLMTPFALVGGEWLLNPLLGAAGLWLIGDLARQATGQEQARGWAMLAALASPQYTVNAISFYAMTGLLTLNLLYLWLLLRPGSRTAMLAGLVGSLALVMHNPVPHALIAAPCVVWLLSRADHRSRIVPLAIGYIPLTALLCLGWPLLTSMMGMRPAGFGAENADFIASWVQRLQDIFVLPNASILWLRSYAAWKTLLWTAPGLILIALLLRPHTTVHRLLLAGFLLTFGFYFFFPADQGHGWGNRYLHPAWGLVPIAVGIYITSTKQSGLTRLLVASGICAGFLATPVFLYTTHSTISMSISLQPPTPEREKSIVFLNHHPSLYTIDLVRNYPADSGTTLRMLSYGAENDKAVVEAIAPGATLQSSDARGSVWLAPPETIFP